MPFTSAHARVHIVASPPGTWERTMQTAFRKFLSIPCIHERTRRFVVALLSPARCSRPRADGVGPLSIAKTATAVGEKYLDTKDGPVLAGCRRRILHSTNRTHPYPIVMTRVVARGRWLRARLTGDGCASISCPRGMPFTSWTRSSPALCRWAYGLKSMRSLKSVERDFIVMTKTNLSRRRNCTRSGRAAARSAIRYSISSWQRRCP